MCNSRLADKEPYEPPMLTPIGNLRDLLASTGSDPCKALYDQYGQEGLNYCCNNILKGDFEHSPLCALYGGG